MQHFQTKTEHLVQTMQNRLDSIKIIETSGVVFAPTKATYLRFYYEIAYFVHAIMNDPDLHKLFNATLDYKNSLDTNPDYPVALEKINHTVKEIATTLLALPQITKLDEDDTKYPDYKNQPRLYKATGLLNNWRHFNSADTVEKDEFGENYLTSTLAVAGRLCARLCEFVPEEQQAQFVELINKLRFHIEWYDYYHHFEHGYQKVLSAEHLSQVYIAVHPTLKMEDSVNNTVKQNMIKEGQAYLGTETIRTLTADCQNIFNYLSEKLYTQLSIEAYVDRFITYISLYYKINFKKGDAEGVMQHKFEEFLFNAGYYPISEMQLQYGRLDTIAVNPEHAFLFEHKQLDLNKADENQLAERIKNAQIQSHIYKDSLNNFPRLNHHVFILLFTNRKVIFKDNVDRITKNGIVFITKVCTVYDKTASNIKDEVTIDINNLIN
jgi:hypothetical protein